MNTVLSASNSPSPAWWFKLGLYHFVASLIDKTLYPTVSHCNEYTGVPYIPAMGIPLMQADASSLDDHSVKVSATDIHCIFRLLLVDTSHRQTPKGLQGRRAGGGRGWVGKFDCITGYH